MRKASIEMDKERGDALRAAAQAPRSFGQGLVAQMVKRREQLISEMHAAESKFKKAEIRHHIKALAKIAAAGGESIPDKTFRRVGNVREGSTGPENRLFLARVMTPDGWEDNIAPVYGGLADQAFKDYMDEKDEEANTALMFEAAKFVRHLQHIAQGGESARAEQARKIRRVALTGGLTSG